MKITNVIAVHQEMYINKKQTKSLTSWGFFLGTHGPNEFAFPVLSGIQPETILLPSSYTICA